MRKEASDNWEYSGAHAESAFRDPRHPAENLVTSAEEHLFIEYLDAGSQKWRTILKKHDGADQRLLDTMRERTAPRPG